MNEFEEELQEIARHLQREKPPVPRMNPRSRMALQASLRSQYAAPVAAGWSLSMVGVAAMGMVATAVLALAIITSIMPTIQTGQNSDLPLVDPTVMIIQGDPEVAPVLVEEPVVDLVDVAPELIPTQSESIPTIIESNPTDVPAPLVMGIPTNQPTASDPTSIPTTAVLATEQTPATQVISNTTEVGCRGDQGRNPRAEMLATQYNVPYAEIIGWFCSGYGFGVIDIAYGLAATNTQTAAEIFALHQSGQSWGAIQQQLGTPGHTNPGQGQGPPDTNPGQGQGPPDTNPGQGQGPPDTNPGQGQGPPDTNPGQGQGQGPPDTNPGQGQGPPDTPPGQGGEPPGGGNSGGGNSGGGNSGGSGRP